MTPSDREIKRKLRVLNHAKETGNVSKTCRFFGVSRQSFYVWKRAYDQFGEQGLAPKKHGVSSENSPLKTPPEIEEKILYIRRHYHLGQLRISWYLRRYHGIQISAGGVRSVLKRHNLNRLPENQKKKALKTVRYEKQVPGHHIQVDVKFLILKNKRGQKTKRFQYTAIDDATRIRALKVYFKHTQQNAIDFIDYVIEKFPFRIQTVRTDNGHEFQSKFHWHVEDLGMRHTYIKPRTPRLNGKVERSHKTDQQEFYQLLKYSGDVDLEKKLQIWENFYNFDRPHGALAGKTPYEILKEKMKL
jgi:transposase InsO family protein